MGIVLFGPSVALEAGWLDRHIVHIYFATFGDIFVTLHGKQNKLLLCLTHKSGASRRSWSVDIFYLQT